MPQTPHNSRWILGVTGASGAIYAQRLLRQLVEAGVDVQLVVSPLGLRLLHDELGIEGLNLDALTGMTADQRAACGASVTVHNHRDVGASIASGSYRCDGMIVCPCSSNSLAAIACGLAQNLLHRAAYVCLKERRRLILVHRETPLTSIDIDNMQRVTAAGAIVAPANPGFYKLPATIEQLADYVVARCLDLMHVPHQLDVRWGAEDRPKKI